MRDLIFIKFVKFFLENPYKEFYLRELAKKLKLSPFVVKKYSDILVKENLILEQKKANLRYFRTNINNLFLKYLKKALNINLLLKSGLTNHIKENIANVSSIVIFGSMAKGENDEKSDIDILIIGKEKFINLDKFEENVNRKITIHIFSWSEWNKKAKEDIAFYFEIINYGIALYGELPLIKWK